MNVQPFVFMLRVHAGSLTAFRSSIEVVALRVPVKRCGAFMKMLGEKLLNRPKYKNVHPDENCDKRLVLLSSAVTSELGGLSEAELKFIRDEGAETSSFEVETDYASYSVDDALRKLLPPGTCIIAFFLMLFLF